MNDLDLKQKIKENLGDALNVNVEAIAKFIVENPGESPFPLVYKNGEKYEIDNQIRQDLSNLIGIQMPFEEKYVVILCKYITEKDFKDKKSLENAKVGDLRKIANNIHPKCKVINEMVAAYMWYYHDYYYAIRYILHENVEIPNIETLSSLEENVDDDSLYICNNGSCGYWDYLDGEGGDGRIMHQLPIICYFEID